jgi:BMFP domain-containing protein YqiC
MQSQNRLFDDFARLMTDAAGAAQGVRRLQGRDPGRQGLVLGAQGGDEVAQHVDLLAGRHVEMERVLRDLDVATREEVDVLRDLVAALRTQNEALAARVAARTIVSASRRTPCAAPAASVIRRAKSSNSRFWLCMAGLQGPRLKARK